MFRWILAVRCVRALAARETRQVRRVHPCPATPVGVGGDPVSVPVLPPALALDENLARLEARVYASDPASRKRLHSESHKRRRRR